MARPSVLAAPVMAMIGAMTPSRRSLSAVRFFGREDGVTSVPGGGKRDEPDQHEDGLNERGDPVVSNNGKSHRIFARLDPRRNWINGLACGSGADGAPDADRDAEQEKADQRDQRGPDRRLDGEVGDDTPRDSHQSGRDDEPGHEPAKRPAAA